VTTSGVDYALWITLRLLIPLAAAVSMLTQRWGRDNVVYFLTVPFFLPFVNIFLSWRQRPQCDVLEVFPPFRRACTWWHLMDVLSLFLLSVFEAATAVIAEIKAVSMIGPVLGTLYVGYSVLSFIARRNLLHARDMVRVYLEVSRPFSADWQPHESAPS